jgi:hypothetical protein
MRRNRVWLAAGACTFAMVFSLWAQARKPGLWEVTSTQTWQKSPFPQGVTPPGAGPHTIQVCLTQQQIDKYGAITPHMPGCTVSNIDKKDSGMKADLICTGRFSGKGTIESTATDSEHAKGSIHFAGTMQMGQNAGAIEWTSESTSVFKSADCGSVKPFPPSGK